MLTKRIPETEPNPFGLSAAGHRCFLCGQFLQDQAVMWSENDGEARPIYLHGDCVFELCPRLLRDALELRYIGRSCWNQVDSHWRGRGA